MTLGEIARALSGANGDADAALAAFNSLSPAGQSAVRAIALKVYSANI